MIFNDTRSAGPSDGKGYIVINTRTFTGATGTTQILGPFSAVPHMITLVRTAGATYDKVWSEKQWNAPDITGTSALYITTSNVVSCGAFGITLPTNSSGTPNNTGMYVKFDTACPVNITGWTGTLKTMTYK